LCSFSVLGQHPSGDGETLDGVHGGLQTTSEAELQKLVDRLDRVSRKYSLLINTDKTKVMASDGIACRILIQNKKTLTGGCVPVPWIPDYRRW